MIKGQRQRDPRTGQCVGVITAELKDEGDATACVLTTDLTISGKAAQFGRGVLADVSCNLIGQFAQRLEADLLAGSAPAAPGLHSRPASSAPTALSRRPPAAAPTTPLPTERAVS